MRHQHGILPTALLGTLFVAVAGLANAAPIWQRNSHMQFGRTGHSATVLSDGKIFIAGGAYSSLGSEAVAEMFDPKSMKFVPIKSPLNCPRFGHTQIVLKNGNVLLAGGSGDFEMATDCVELFDVKTREFKTIEPLGKPRAGHSGVLLPNGNALVVGGFTGDEYSNTIEVFSTNTGEFKKLEAVLAQGRTNHTTTLLKNRYLVVAGGEGIIGENNSSDAGSPGFFSDAEIFDLDAAPITRTVIKLNSPRALHSALALDENRVAFIGGLKGIGKTVGEIEVLTVSPYFSVMQVGTLAVSRNLHQTNTLGKDAFLVSGGVSNGVPLKSTEVCRFNAESSNIFCRESEALKRSRWSHTTVAVPEKGILAFGGMSSEPDKGNKSGGPTNTFEMIKWP